MPMLRHPLAVLIAIGWAMTMTLIGLTSPVWLFWLLKLSAHDVNMHSVSLTGGGALSLVFNILLGIWASGLREKLIRQRKDYRTSSRQTLLGPGLEALVFMMMLLPVIMVMLCEELVSILYIYPG